MITLNKLIEKKILKHSFLYEVQLDLLDEDVNYLINKIEQGIKESNYNFKTNVQGFMTPFNFFIKDEVYLKYLIQTMEFLQNQTCDRPFGLIEAWGIKMNKKHYTRFHDHTPSEICGSLYLNDCEHSLKFPEYNLEIPLKKGTFLIFSGNLRHGADAIKNDMSRYAIPFSGNYNSPWDANI